MKKQSLAFRIGITALVILVLAAAVIGIIGLIAGWQGSTRFSDAFFITGSILIVVGLLSLIGTYSQRSSFGVQYSQSAGDMNIQERASRWMADIAQGFNLLIICTISGGLLIGAAILVDKLFR